MHTRGRFTWRVGCLALLLGPLLLTTAWGATCKDCGELSKSELQQVVNPHLSTRTGGFFGLETRRDTFRMDVGDCTEALSEEIEPHMVAAKLILRGRGEVWNCPHSKSSMTISASISHEDRTEWGESAGFEGTMKAVVAEMKLKYERSRGGSDSITETTDLSQTLSAAYCHRIPWLAYLEVGDFEVKWRYKSSRIYAWWTKNSLTGATVHRKGKHTQDCGEFDVTLERKAPLSWTLHLGQWSCGLGCEGAAVTPRDLGFFPPVPAYIPEPSLPEGIRWPEHDDPPDPSVSEPDDGPSEPPVTTADPDEGDAPPAADPDAGDPQTDDPPADGG